MEHHEIAIRELKKVKKTIEGIIRHHQSTIKYLNSLIKKSEKKLKVTTKGKNCCICDGCFGLECYDGETLSQHEFCNKHKKLIKKILELSRR